MGIDLVGVDLVGVDFVGVDLVGGHLKYCYRNKPPSCLYSGGVLTMTAVLAELVVIVTLVDFPVLMKALL